MSVYLVCWPIVGGRESKSFEAVLRQFWGSFRALLVETLLVKVGVDMTLPMTKGNDVFSVKNLQKDPQKKVPRKFQKLGRLEKLVFKKKKNR